MNTLALSQTIFYFVSSFAVIIVGILLIVTIYYLICILRDTRNIFDDFNWTYKNIKTIVKKFNNFLNKKRNVKFCAGYENRTRVSTLGRSHSTTKPIPHLMLNTECSTY